ncbi:MAG: DNA-binding protein [Campylobacteraceae bacterium]
MQIAFKKVVKEGLDFSLHVKETKFFGKVYPKRDSLVLCQGDIKGEVSHICDRCGKDMVLDVNEKVEILISDGIYEGDTDEFDVVEFYDGLIDFDELLNSEIEAIKSDYHYCENCLKN